MHSSLIIDKCRPSCLQYDAGHVKSGLINIMERYLSSTLRCTPDCFIVVRKRWYPLEVQTSYSYQPDTTRAADPCGGGL